ncbi:MAG: PQQ-binding-like beta-propeller repeat protein [Anaerolineales bacterium]|nr:PQQ-binding-like beta-propeller repeat protein [Anaerolineales bacterium]MCX7756224.1 PQQ-binding-like beta-propeller repeat protein [Anaerolineales bacterium]MDW8277416.1 PQQ-binding-like beta-propeller repeat protein [Anaerolineales bacterium]
MKFNRMFLFALFILLTLALSACGAPPATNWPGLSTDGNLIYLSANSHVYLVQAQNGTETTVNLSGKVTPLRFPLEFDGRMSFYAPVALAPQGVFIVGSASSTGHALYAAQASNASIVWAFEGTKPWLAGPLLLGETVFAPAGDGYLYAFDLNGGKRWEKKLSEHALWTSPVTDGEHLYLATLDHMLYCLDPQSGDILWSKDLENGIIGAPALSEGVLYLGTLSGNLYAIQAADGNVKWVKTLEGSIWGTPGLRDETLYVGTVFGRSGKFYALEAATGDVKWFRDEEGSIVAGPLVLDEQVIYVTEMGRVQSLDLNGAPQWQDNFEKNKIYTPPLLVNDMIVVAPMGSQFLMVAYDRNGAKKWTFTPAQ